MLKATSLFGALIIATTGAAHAADVPSAAPSDRPKAKIQTPDLLKLKTHAAVVKSRAVDPAKYEALFTCYQGMTGKKPLHAEPVPPMAEGAPYMVFDDSNKIQQFAILTKQGMRLITPNPEKQKDGSELYYLNFSMPGTKAEEHVSVQMKEQASDDMKIVRQTDSKDTKELAKFKEHEKPMEKATHLDLSMSISALRDQFAIPEARGPKYAADQRAHLEEFLRSECKEEKPDCKSTSLPKGQINRKRVDAKIAELTERLEDIKSCVKSGDEKITLDAKKQVTKLNEEVKFIEELKAHPEQGSGAKPSAVAAKSAQ